jgi:hypothetical protein
MGIHKYDDYIHEYHKLWVPRTRSLSNRCGFPSPCSILCILGCVLKLTLPGDLYGDTYCVDLQTDANNCGVCDNVCSSGTCAAGECCPFGTIACGDSCISWNNDINNCNGCGNVCTAPNNYCSYGQCQQCDYSAGKSLCPDPNSSGNTFCTDLKSDLGNCGSCDNPCPNGACASGNCCPGQYQIGIACGDSCYFANKDTNHCGSCNNACPAPDSYCRNGWCVTCDFSAGWGICPYNDGSGNYECQDLTSEHYNCGGCDNVCPEASSTVFRVVVRSVRWTRCLVRTLMWLLAIIVPVNVQLRINIQMMNANSTSYSVLFS